MIKTFGAMNGIINYQKTDFHVVSLKLYIMFTAQTLTEQTKNSFIDFTF